MSTSVIPPRLFATAAEWETLARRFEAAELSREEWTHEAHIAMAAWYLVRHEPDEALSLVRAGIQRINATHGPSPSGRGYHETLTRLYMTLVRRALARRTLRRPLLDAVNGVVAELTDRDIPLQYYSPARLFSAEARTVWLPPDIRALP
ncbi:MAG TPA: hypothetical protein VKH19_06045 [Gemmatimonadaceae bacterium]|nr:hypothetical protein [Gemmatimonadaceae bacterium]